MTEKPMEFAFLNSILRSDTFPPLDPWMSGQSISYYYFGYVMIGFLTKLSGLTSNYTFNLALALIGALAATGVCSLVYNLISLSARRRPSFKRALAERYAVFAGVIAVVLGNLEAWVELLNNNNLLPSAMRTWLAVGDLPAAGGSPGLLPADWMWWWRASRVVGSVTTPTIFGGPSVRDYTINELPFFSFLLGDVHPHVLALPFGLLCLALALNLLASGQIQDIRFWLHQRRLELVVLVLCFGGLAFLNTWDLPTYLLVLVLAYGIGLYWQCRCFDRRGLVQIAAFAVTVLVLGLVAYFPFFLTFGSQARGIGVVAIRTSLPQFWLFWAPFGFLVMVFLFSQAVQWWGNRGSMPSESSRSRWDLLWWLLIPFVLLVLIVRGETLAMLVLGLAVAIKLLWQWIAAPVTSTASRLAVAIATEGAANDESSELAVPLASEAIVDFGPTQANQNVDTAGERHVSVAFANGPDLGRVFMLVLVVVALALLAGGEMFFLRDLFDNRMNTIFKIYYQAWTLLAVAVGFLCFYLRHNGTSWPTKTLSDGLRKLAVGGFIVLVIMGLYYPIASAITKTGGFAAAPQFDGQAYLAQARPDDYNAILWLRSTVVGSPVILEAPGQSYGPQSRVSEFTGIPTVLGWVGHENQWRGTSVETDRRKADVDTIFTTRDNALAQKLMNKYGVTYVYIGDIERETYAASGNASLQKFASFMDVVYHNNSVTIYKIRN
jgi:uncharacterized membrane protein